MAGLCEGGNEPPGSLKATLEGPRPISRLLVSRSHSEAEVNDHPTRMELGNVLTFIEFPLMDLKIECVDELSSKITAFMDEDPKKIKEEEEEEEKEEEGGEEEEEIKGLGCDTIESCTGNRCSLTVYCTEEYTTETLAPAIEETLHDFNIDGTQCHVPGSRQRALASVYYKSGSTYHLMGARYLTFLQGVLLELCEDLPLALRQQMWFQDDSVPAYFSLAVHEHLHQTFGERWIGRGGPAPWRPWSPDLTPLDFFILGPHQAPCL
ncbi:hypothetical protein ANN_09370 [Periplaneta americana]|uniref:Uncharacterized protein n=1 Tax=Periplaneta americana TaxID=6978 RepID=A0ABQ8TP30_PERAM|nr:hypothetical protein ANN_09370 [Periplaneta americana]